MNSDKSFYKRAFDESVEAIGIFDTNDVIIDVNSAFERLFEYSKEDLIGKGFPGYFAYSSDEFLTWIERLRKGEGTVDHMSARKSKSGRLINVSMSVSPIFDSKRNLIAIAVSYRDITELMLSRKELSFYNLIYQNINEAIISTDLFDNISSWNRAAEQLFGFSREESLGKNILEIIPNLKETNFYSQAQIKMLYSNAESYLFANDRTIKIKGNPIFDPSNSLQGMLFLCLDKTEEFAIQEKLRNSEIEKTTILDNQTDVVILQDLNSKVLWANKKALSTLKLPLEEIKGTFCYNLWGKGNKVCEGCPVESAKMTGKVEVVEKAAPNGTYWNIKAIPIFDAKGEITKLLEIAEDVTEVRKHSIQLAERERQYRTLFNTSQVGIVVFAGGNPTIYNDKILKILEIEDFSLLSAFDSYSFIHPEDIDYVKVFASKLRVELNSNFTFNFRIITKSGSLKYLTVNVTRYSLNDIEHYQVVAMDNTELTEMSHKQKSLAVESVYLQSKNKIIEQIAKKYQEIALKYKITERDNKSIAKLYTSFFEPEKDWNVTKAHFEAVHKDFFSSLKQDHPSLTQNELRHCAYIRMNYTTKEIARIYNVEATSIQKARVRLKKKLNLGENDDLYMFIMGI